MTSPYDENYSGAVYVYKWNGDKNDAFGTSISITVDGNRFIAGAYGDDENGGNDSGSVYVYK